MDVTPVTSHSPSVSRQPRYDVFLSFRGLDTRHHFMRFLQMKLAGESFDVYIDDKDLEKGKNINDGLIEAINHSMISIPIISKNYPSSESCLMELEHMLKRMDNNNHIVIPIFYFVDPSDVCHYSGPFAMSPLGHNHTHIDSWKSALDRIGNISGYHICKENERIHNEIIQQIARTVQQNLKAEELIVPKQLVIVDCHVQSIMERLKVDYRNQQAVTIDETLTKVLVISGIVGVGKTVLAKYVYNKLCHLYDYCSFCEQIQAQIEHNDIVSVQEKLISGLKKDAPKFNSRDKALTYIQKKFLKKKVLVLLDDVNDHEQLRELVGELDWLGLGSRVILTSQRHDVLRNINGAESFVLEPMKQDEALKLFCKHAFGMDSPRKEFETLSTDIVAATDRLPLALMATGSFLFAIKSKKAWKDILTSLEVSPHKRVQEALEKSCADLDKNAWEIFLDIACFFTGMDKRIPYYMWDDCDYCPSGMIPTLHDRSLVKIGENKELLMHEILKKFGQEIVRKEKPSEPSERSRLWKHNEAVSVLTRRKGTEKVGALRLKFDYGSKDISFERHHFNGLQNLRFLKLDRADIRGNFGDGLSSLRWLDWQGCPKSFDDQSLNLNVQNLVILDLSWSQVDQDWEGWELLVEARKLKVLKLTSCFQLIDTPKFPFSMELERLILEGCSRLEFINQSFGYLRNLVSLNMKQCNRLNKLPNLGPMASLEELVIDGTSISQIDFQTGFMKKLKTLSARDCKHLTMISDSIGYLDSLKHLALDGTGINTLWESNGSPKKLKTLSLKNCRDLTHLSNGIGKLESLKFLDVSDTVIRELPPIEDWKAMKVLRMRGTFIEEFPEVILNLDKLEEIDFSFCRNLKGSIQGLDIWKLSSLAILKLSYTQICCLPESFHRLPRLQELDIFGCDKLERLPKLPSSLINVRCPSDLSPLDPDVLNE